MNTSWVILTRPSKTSAAARRRRTIRFSIMLLLALPTMVAAQSTNLPVDADLTPAPSSQSSTTPTAALSPPSTPVAPTSIGAITPPQAAEHPNNQAAPTPSTCQTPPSSDGTYQQDDLIGAAEGVFGQGAHGLADLIQSILKKQGRPDAYIVGREAGGAFAVGLRYGSGTLCSLRRGKAPVYWTGPSVGFDFGANAANTFVLVYNLNHRKDLYQRFADGEGQAYLIGGFNVSYLRHGDIVLIPVRMGVGLRLGINAGYMKFSPKQRWLPF